MIQTISSSDFSETIISRYLGQFPLRTTSADMLYLPFAQPEAGQNPLAQSVSNMLILNRCFYENNIFNIQLNLRFLNGVIGKITEKINESAARHIGMLEKSSLVLADILPQAGTKLSRHKAVNGVGTPAAMLYRQPDTGTANTEADRRITLSRAESALPGSSEPADLRPRVPEVKENSSAGRTPMEQGYTPGHLIARRGGDTPPQTLLKLQGSGEPQSPILLQLPNAGYLTILSPLLMSGRGAAFWCGRLWGLLPKQGRAPGAKDSLMNPGAPGFDFAGLPLVQRSWEPRTQALTAQPRTMSTDIIWGDPETPRQAPRLPNAVSQTGHPRMPPPTQAQSRIPAESAFMPEHAAWQAATQTPRARQAKSAQTVASEAEARADSPFRPNLARSARLLPSLARMKFPQTAWTPGGSAATPAVTADANGFPTRYSFIRAGSPLRAEDILRFPTVAAQPESPVYPPAARSVRIPGQSPTEPRKSTPKGYHRALNADALVGPGMKPTGAIQLGRAMTSYSAYAAVTSGAEMTVPPPWQGDAANRPDDASGKRRAARQTEAPGAPILYRKEARPAASTAQSPEKTNYNDDIAFIKKTAKQKSNTTHTSQANTAINIAGSAALPQERAASQEQQVNAIADQVYKALERRLRSERMRKGLL